MVAKKAELPFLVDQGDLRLCVRKRPGCLEFGPYMPFYQHHVCASCLEADSRDVGDGRMGEIPGHGGVGRLFQRAEEDDDGEEG